MPENIGGSVVVVGNRKKLGFLASFFLSLRGNVIS